MEELEKYLNKCYLETNDELVFVYRFVKVNGLYGFLCYDIQIKPEDVWIYADFPVDQEGELEFIKSFIPELDPRCRAKEISEDYYYELITHIEKLKTLQDTFRENVKDLVKNVWIGQRSIKN